MVRRNWTREQDLAVLYAKLTHGDIFRRHADLGHLAAAMGRSTASLLMRKANFDSLDPASSSSGLGNAAILTKDIWNEYQKNPVEVTVEARLAYLNILGQGLKR